MFAQNDEMGLGAVQALRKRVSKPGKDIKIITVDATKGAFQAMIAGEINTVVECNPLLAPQVYEAALKAAQRRDLPSGYRPSKACSMRRRTPPADVLPSRKY